MRIGVLSLTLASLFISSTALADEDSYFLEQLPKVAPEPGRAKATVQRPPWCAGVKRGNENRNSIYRTIENAQQYWNYLPKAAELACYYAADPVVAQATAVITQMWINITGMSEADAITSLTARVHADAFLAQKKTLCDALAVDVETAGEAEANGKSLVTLFGCKGSDAGEPYGMWSMTSNTPRELLYYLDVGMTKPDELVRLAYVIDQSRYAENQKTEEFYQRLVGYAVDQVDFKLFTPATVMAAIDAPPYRGNTYARVIALESAAYAQKTTAILADEVARKSKDDAWKELLATAPQRGIAELAKASEQFKAELARSNELEKKVWTKRTSATGCWATLKKDFVAVTKSLDHTSDDAFIAGLSQPVPSLLLTRLATCAAVEPSRAYTHVVSSGDQAGFLASVAQRVRFTPGPRHAAYYATLDAFSKIAAERERFPIKASHLAFVKDGSMLLASVTVRGGINPSDRTQEGIVKSVKKVAGGVLVTFPTNKYQRPQRLCTDTNKIDRIWDGKVLYQRQCVWTGKMETIDATVDPITIPAEWAEGIAAGTVISYIAGYMGPTGMPVAVFKDKTKKQLIGFLGIAL